MLVVLSCFFQTRIFNLSYRQLSALSSWVSPQLSQALHTSAWYSPDLGWPCCLSFSWPRVMPAPPFDYSQPKPFLPVSHKASQSSPQLAMWPTGRLQLSACLLSCPHVLEGVLSTGVQVVAVHTAVWLPGAGLLSPCSSCLSAPFLNCHCNGTACNYFLVCPWDLGPTTLKLPRSVKVRVHLKKTCSMSRNPPLPSTYFKSS